MKTKTLLLITLFTFFSHFSFSQVQDLASLAQGKMVLSTTLFDTDRKVYGYFYLYKQELNKESYNIEYVLLDKNLNKVLNGTFTSSALAERILESKSARAIFDADLLGKDEIIIYKQMSLDYYFNRPYSYIILSLKDNKVSKELCYDGNTFFNLPEDKAGLEELVKKKKQSKNLSYCYAYVYSKGKHTGLLAKEIYSKKTEIIPYLSKTLKFYDKEKNLLWSYEYNPNGTKKDYVLFNQIESKDDNLYYIQRHVKDDKIDAIKVVALDFNGQKKYEYDLETSTSEYNHYLYAEEIGNKLILCGLYSEYNKKKGFQADKNLGFYRIVLDQKGKEIEKIYTKWSDYSAFIEIDEDGKVEKNFRLTNPQFYYFKDGSISILTEKYKPYSTNFFGFESPSKTSDFALFNMDKNFKIKTVDVIKKDVSKYNYTDLLYSQYIKDQTGVVFFYANETKLDKEKVYMLGINTIIDGKLTEEKIPLTSKKKFAIYPSIAKEGYILLNERNEDEKYNQIRLEKLNY